MEALEEASSSSERVGPDNMDSGKDHEELACRELLAPSLLMSCIACITLPAALWPTHYLHVL